LVPSASPTSPESAPHRVRSPRPHHHERERERETDGRRPVAASHGGRRRPLQAQIRRGPTRYARAESPRPQNLSS
uniref:Uncharacterized protein n=1 Tax=Aegilops tauschii subsp. strangulata TaxID=200361 RepID=A0A453JKW0_AEGTS